MVTLILGRSSKMEKNESLVISDNEITNNSPGRDLNIGTHISFNEVKNRSNALANLLERSKNFVKQIKNINTCSKSYKSIFSPVQVEKS